MSCELRYAARRFHSDLEINRCVASKKLRQLGRDLSWLSQLVTPALAICSAPPSMSWRNAPQVESEFCLEPIILSQIAVDGYGCDLQHRALNVESCGLDINKHYSFIR